MLIPRLDFAKHCGIESRQLSIYIKRNKVLVSENEMIDISNETNNAFYEKRKHKSKLETELPAVKLNRVVTKKTAPKKEVIQTTETVDEFSDIAENDDAVNDIIGSISGDDIVESQAELEKRKVYLGNKLLEERIEIERVKKDKLHGLVVPTQLVSVVFTQHSKNIASEFKNGADDWIIRIEKKLDLSREEVASLRGGLVDVINKSVKKSVETSKKQIYSIVRQYKEVRGKGERK